MLHQGIAKTSVSDPEILFLGKIGFLCLLVSCFLSCGTVKIYEEPDKPVFYSNSINDDTLEHADSLKVVCFNIEKAEKIGQAVAELQSFEKTRDSDVYLLQEMDEKGTDSIARKLGLNYLYIPIAFNKLLKKNMGNAILTKGTIHFYEKLILPHAKWTNKRRRHATVGEVNIHNQKILVYSVHTETIILSRKKRMEQVDAILEHARAKLPDYEYVLIGGDFNTLCRKDSKLVVKKLSASGFDWSTSTVGSTGKAFFGLIKPTHDYIFSKGLKQAGAGKIEAAKSSDHYPIYAEFRY